MSGRTRPTRRAVRIEERLLLGPNRPRGGAFPDWLEASYAAFRERVTDPAYPCYFGTVAEKAGDLYLTYVVDDETADLFDSLVEFGRLAEEASGRRLTLAAFFPPEPVARDHEYYRDRVWSILQGLVDRDPWPWPASRPSDPDDPLWELTIAGTSYFVFAASPSYESRLSRNLGPSLALLFQPRSAFEGIEADRPAGVRARRRIRQRLEAWDGVPPHPDLADFGDPDGREWKQIVLPDDDRPTLGKCPLSVPAEGRARRTGSRPAPATGGTLIDLLRERAEQKPDATLFRFLERGEVETDALTYAGLETRARATAARIQAHAAPGERALLLYPPGLDFVVAFFGCLYAGLIAVPCYPPSRRRGLDKVRACADDAQPALVLTTSSLRDRLDDEHRRAAAGDAPVWIAPTEGGTGAAADWVEPSVDGSTLAFLQYTSGSTATPKGVMVGHGNLLHNQEAIRRAFAQSERSVVVGWLPLYHDMGLIGNVLQPLYSGGTCILMPPVAFLQRPLRWLDVIDRYRATTSGGPDFAYSLCLRKTTQEQREALDLRSWSVAFDGAEPVRPRTLDRFAEAFAPAGFDRRAFRPCYGLAEATLFVACEASPQGPRTADLDADALAGDRVEPAEGERVATLVSCGAVADGHEVAIAEPEASRRAGDGAVGEIWFRGPSVAAGYWNRPDETSRTFGARLEGAGPNPFLRTGDLGFVRDGRLFVTGRLKDLVILRGRNHYPQDLELTAEESHDAIRPGCSVAFAVEEEAGERLQVVIEVERHREGEAAEVVRSVRRLLAERHEVHAHDVVAVRRGGVPKTSSGKVRRRACRDLYLAGGLDVVASAVAGMTAPGEGEREGAAFEHRTTEIAEVVRAIALRVTGSGAEAGALGLDEPLSALGIDSLMAVELKGEIEEALAVAVSLDDLLAGPTPRELAERMLALAPPAPGTSAPEVEVADRPDPEIPLAHGQRALWFLQQVSPESAAYHVVAAVRLHGELDTEALEASLQVLSDRHASLRTTFHATDGEPVQRVHDRLEPGFRAIDARGWSEAELQRGLCEEAYAPFDLEEGPLVRCAVLHRSDREHALVLSFHHLVIDFWSLALWVAELDEEYRLRVRGGVTIEREPPVVRYGDFVRWQRRLLEGARGEALRAYWRDRLGDRVPFLELPTDRPRPPVQTHEGASRALSLRPELAERLRELARGSGATLYTVLLTAYFVLLRRYSGQADLTCGSPTAARTRPELAGLVGYLVNPVVVRADLGGSPVFDELLQVLRRTVTEALEHQDYPFALLAEQLQPDRAPGRTPLFQTLFVLHRTRPGGEPAMAEVALGEGGARSELGGLAAESIALERRPAQFDLTLAAAETASGGLGLSLSFNTDLFDAASADRMLGHYETLLAGAVDRPREAIDVLPLLTATERAQARVQDAGPVLDLPLETDVSEVFRRVAAERPDAPALVLDGHLVSYGELARRAAAVAESLDALELPPGSVVGVHVERRPELVAALLGTLEAGHAYLPLDPSYPAERLGFMLGDAGARAVLTLGRLADSLPPSDALVVRIDREAAGRPVRRAEGPRRRGAGGGLAYVNYTSGSTGRPKGVMISHRSVLNFFVGMDERVGCGPDDTLLAVTSISFDISVLELLWTVSRGARVVLASDDSVLRVGGGPDRAPARRPSTPVDLSLFYFASEHVGGEHDKYRLLLEGARFADRNGFAAVWTPERHFHAFGGLYPNPSVTSAALATVTERVALRAGSVVLPLHNPLRVAEEWSVVDNLSGGRVGIAFASGWHADDFTFAPESFRDRKEVMFRGIETVQRLWRGESVEVVGGAGNRIEVSVLPRPLQPELPTWITAAGSPETFERAGAIGANVLTHLLGQSLEELAEKIALYRRARRAAGHDPDTGTVSLMLHTFLGEDRGRVRETVREPFTAYLRSSVGLIRNLVRSQGLDLDLETMSPADMDDLLAFAFDRYFETSALFGDLDGAAGMLARIGEIGADEVACLIDFGIAPAVVLESLDHLAELTRTRAAAPPRREAPSLSLLAARTRPTLLQCTPSFASLLTAYADELVALRGLRTLLLGGEALPPPLARQVSEAFGVPITNLYGPTETTVWSASHPVDPEAPSVPIGRPIANTDLMVLGSGLEPLPPRAVGEIYIGGDGVAYGYLGRPALTAERFLPHPASRSPGDRVYRTGDLGSRRPDGVLEFRGRADQQVKIRGHRVELGEIETVLREHPAVREVATRYWNGSSDVGLVAYFVPEPDGAEPPADELRGFLASRVPEAMLPQRFVALADLPRTLNRKIDRGALPLPDTARAVAAEYVEPSDDLERAIADIWCDVLGVDKVGRRDNFFDLGGHSLLMAVAHRRLQDRLAVQVPLVKLLEHPKVHLLAAFLKREQTDLFSVDQARERGRKQLAGRGRLRNRALERVRGR